MTSEDQRSSSVRSNFGLDLAKVLTVITIVVLLNEYSFLINPSGSIAYFPLVIPFRTLAADFGTFCAALLLILVRSKMGVLRVMYAATAGFLVGLVYLMYDTLLVYGLDWRLVAAGTVITALFTWASMAKQPKNPGSPRQLILAGVVIGELLFALIAPTIIGLIAYGP